MGRRGECSRIAGQHRGGIARGFASGATMGERRGSWTSFTVHRARAIEDGDADTGSTHHASLLSLGLGGAGVTVIRRGRAPGAATVPARRDVGYADRLVALVVGDHPAGVSSR